MGIKKKYYGSGLGVGILLVQALDDLLSSAKEMVFYFNKNGKLLEATPQSIGFLLRSDNELHDAFLKEEKMNNDVFRKYLIAMNNKYPLTFPNVQ